MFCVFIDIYYLEIVVCSDVEEKGMGLKYNIKKKKIGFFFKKLKIVIVELEWYLENFIDMIKVIIYFVKEIEYSSYIGRR